MENLKKIEEHNSKDLGFKMGVNHFSDVSDEQFLEEQANKVMAEDIGHPSVQMGRN